MLASDVHELLSSDGDSSKELSNPNNIQGTVNEESGQGTQYSLTVTAESGKETQFSQYYSRIETV